MRPRPPETKTTKRGDKRRAQPRTGKNKIIRIICGTARQTPSARRPEGSRQSKGSRRPRPGAEAPQKRRQPVGGGRWGQSRTRNNTIIQIICGILRPRPTDNVCPQARGKPSKQRQPEARGQGPCAQGDLLKRRRQIAKRQKAGKNRIIRIICGAARQRPPTRRRPRGGRDQRLRNSEDHR